MKAKVTIFFIFHILLFFSSGGDLFSEDLSVKDYNSEVVQRSGIGFILALPSHLSTELLFVPELSEENAHLRFSMMHDVSAAYEAKKLILNNKVDLIVLIGSCYSKLPEIDYGDLIYVDGYLCQQQEMIFEKKTDADEIFYLTFRNQDLSERIENFLEKEGECMATLFDKHGLRRSVKNKMLHGLVCSGDSFFISETYFNELKKDYPFLRAGDIEGYAVAKVCDKYNIPLISVKMIFPEINENISLKTWFSLHKESVEAFFKKFIEDMSLFFSNNKP